MTLYACTHCPRTFDHLEPLSDKPMLCVICKAYERFGRGVAEGTVMVDGHWRCNAHRYTPDSYAREAPAPMPPAKPEKVDIRAWEDEWEARRRRKNTQ